MISNCFFQVCFFPAVYGVIFKDSFFFEHTGVLLQELCCVYLNQAIIESGRRPYIAILYLYADVVFYLYVPRFFLLLDA